MSFLSDTNEEEPSSKKRRWFWKAYEDGQANADMAAPAAMGILREREQEGVCHKYSSTPHPPHLTPTFCPVPFTSPSYICIGKTLKRKRLMLNQTVVKEEEDETCRPLLNGMLTQEVRTRVRERVS
jgi:hypothetical protein